MGSIEVPAPVRPSQIEFKHEKLGQIVGWTRDTNIVQFRGLPFASIPGRFRQSVLTTKLPQQPFIATNPGTTCPQPPLPYFPYWEAPLPEDLPVLEAPKVDELSCLNLSLTIPQKSLENPGRKTPVLVFIHGGGFVGGSQAIQLGGREVFDGTGLVRHSIRDGKDIIYVAINYRVGPLGFLASKELVEFNKTHNEDVGNYGLHDQRRALEWIAEFIGGFGGDPDNITIQGTSAGAASCHYQSIFPDRKFKRAILASGTYLGIGALPVTRHQTRFDEVLQSVAPELPADQAFDQLLSCDVKKVTDSLFWDVCHPVVDDAYIFEKNLSGDVADDNLPDTMVGATTFEEDIAGMILVDFPSMKPKADKDMLEKLDSVISSNHTLKSPETFPFDQPGVLEAYGLAETTQTPSKNLPSWAHLLGNILFDIPSIYTAVAAQRSSGNNRVWLYRYALTNTYLKSHSYRKAHHGVNDLFLFNVAPELIPLEDQDSWNAGVEQTQKSWVEFVNGESPWAAIRPDSSAKSTASIGPVFRFADNGKSREYDTLEESDGPELAGQFHAILQATRL